MSSLLNIKDLPYEQQERISRDLTIKIEQTSFQKRKGMITKPLIGYQLDGDILRLPYTYAGILQGRPAFNPVKPDINVQYTGSLRDYQESIVKEALEQLNTYSTTSLNLYTGAGKTVIASYLGCRTRKTTLVLINATVLNSQWLETFTEHTNCKTWVVPEGKKIPDQCPDVIVCMSGRVNKIPEEWGQRIGTLIIDESHLFCTPGSIAPLLKYQPNYIISCSATPETRTGSHKLMQAIVGTHEVFRPIPFPFHITKLLTGVVPKLPSGVATSDWSEVTKALSHNQQRNMLIVNIILGQPHRKYLILTWCAEHVQLLQAYLTHYGIDNDVMVGSKKSYSDSHVLVGTIDKIGTGFDEKNACDNFGGRRIDTVILCGSTYSQGLLFQMVGRTFRSDDPHIIDLVDSLPTLERHWTEREKWYRKHKTKITSVEAPGYQKPKAVKRKTVRTVDEELQGELEFIDSIRYR